MRYEVGALGGGVVVEVPPGFVTDGASVPRVFWALLPAWGRYSRAAVVHDYLCERINAGDPLQFAASRRVADGIFLEAMSVCGVSFPVRVLMWLAVRVEARWTGKP